MNPSSLQSKASSKRFSFEIDWAKDYQRLWLFVVCGLFAVWVSSTMGSVGSGLLCSLVLLSLVALTYFSSRQSQDGGVRKPTVVSLLTDQHCQLAQVRSRTASSTHDQEQLFRQVFDHAAGMALVSPGGEWVTVNRSLCEVLGYANEDLPVRSLEEIAHPDDLGTTLVQIENLAAGRMKSHQAELRLTHKLGHHIWMLLNISAVHNSFGNVSHLIFQFQDITDRKMEEERLVHSVFHDALTGLPNRALFMDRLHLATERARRRKDQLFAVLFLDLDCFKTVNDSMGHIMGDQLLIQVSRRLRACLRTTDTIARLGGDEFTILLEDLSGELESIRIVERLQSELRRPFNIGSRNILVTASIGLTSSKHKYERAEEILRDADIAMYRAKSSGKASYEVFDQEEQNPPVEMSDLGSELEKAADDNQLLLHYQPIVSLETGKLCAFEALVRWQHPHLGLISPNEFIPLAEDAGSIGRVGNWVLREACTQLKRWQQAFPFHRALAITVNLSGKQFTQPDLIDQVIEILQDTGVDPRNLKLEITETTLMENIGTATAVLQQLRALGVEIAVDDFGTGYSSLSYLHTLPVSLLKIDRSFVNAMVEKPDRAEIVKTILTLARGLKIRVVAEGVETLEQLLALRRLRCDGGQGFLFSKPVNAETVHSLLANKNQWHGIITSLGSDDHFIENGSGVRRNVLGDFSAPQRLLRAV